MVLYYLMTEVMSGLITEMTEAMSSLITHVMTVSDEVVKFDTLELPIPTIVTSYSAEKQREIFEYLSEMHEKERIGYKIAFDHLGTSFDICRSNGFITWKRNKV